MKQNVFAIRWRYSSYNMKLKACDVLAQKSNLMNRKWYEGLTLVRPTMVTQMSRQTCLCVRDS
jgi:hypothetical protein